MNTKNKNNNQPVQYTSVVYFHGMGNQRRYEELSRLVDALDAYSQSDSCQPDWRLVKIKPRIEDSRSVDHERITYIRAYYKNVKERSWDDVTNLRFYEVYWAPVMAKGAKAKEVIKWLFSTVIRPFRTYFSPWRERQRLRRAILLKLREREHLWSKDFKSYDFKNLLFAYDEFEGSQAIADYPKGNFKEFKNFLAKKYKNKPGKKAKLVALAKLWRKVYCRYELRNFVVLVSIALSLLIAFVLSLALVFMVLQFIADLGVVTFLEENNFLDLANSLSPSVKNAFPLLIGAASLFGISHFLSRYLGDVYQWTTYEETDTKHKNRSEVIKRGMETLTHVLGDPNCERVVVISHSLGTAVAQDTLLSLTHLNRAQNEEEPMAGPIALEKIEHFITLASPVDKIQYLFESFRSAYHRYRRVVDDLRGDLGTAPFSKNRKPHIHWINYWDRGDVVSGELYSVSNRRWVELNVDNVEVNHFHFPEPASSHLAYFNHRKVIGDLFNIICRRMYSFVTLKSEHGKGKDYDSVRIGPGKPAQVAKFYLVLMIAFPYLVIANTVIRFYDTTAVVKGWLGLPLITVFAILVIGFLYSVKKGHLEPLKNKHKAKSYAC
ncbi:MAG: hypothetical protein P8Y24_12885 [Gammaproteobacteria bacterium]|jgi:hypothetical protein